MGIDHRRTHVRVPQQLLHRANVCTRLQQVHGEAVAQGVQAPNQLWSDDITYIQTDEGWLYLAAVIDLFSRQVVGWSCSRTCRRAWSRMRSKVGACVYR
jgi:transposase InsO family protein